MDRPVSAARAWLLALLLAGAALRLSGQAGALRIQILAPVSTPEGRREIALDRYARFHVLLTNQSPEALRLWKDWNTWGYFNLTFLWKAGETTYAVRRKAPAGWDGDFPDYWTLMPGESLVLEVDMASGQWEGIPDLYGERIPASLQAFYENKPDLLSAEFGIWTGKVVSPPLQVIFR
jgi:hypothetical protein